MKFDAQKIIDEHDGRCKTRNGRDAVIYKVNNSDWNYPVHGAVDEEVFTWTLDGVHHTDSENDTIDLIMPRTVVAEYGVNHIHESGEDTKRIRIGHFDEGLNIKLRLYSDDTVESEVVK